MGILTCAVEGELDRESPSKSDSKLGESTQDFVGIWASEETVKEIISLLKNLSHTGVNINAICYTIDYVMTHSFGMKVTASSLIDKYWRYSIQKISHWFNSQSSRSNSVTSFFAFGTTWRQTEHQLENEWWMMTHGRGWVQILSGCDRLDTADDCMHLFHPLCLFLTLGLTLLNFSCTPESDSESELDVYSSLELDELSSEEIAPALGHSFCSSKSLRENKSTSFIEVAILEW